MSNNNTLNKYSSLSHPDIQFIISYLKQEEQRIKDNIKVLEVKMLNKHKEVVLLEEEKEEQDKQRINKLKQKR